MELDIVRSLYYMRSIFNCGNWLVVSSIQYGAIANLLRIVEAVCLFPVGSVHFFKGEFAVLAKCASFFLNIKLSIRTKRRQWKDQGHLLPWETLNLKSFFLLVFLLCLQSMPIVCSCRPAPGVACDITQQYNGMPVFSWTEKFYNKKRRNRNEEVLEKFTNIVIEKMVRVDEKVRVLLFCCLMAKVVWIEYFN